MKSRKELILKALEQAKDFRSAPRLFTAEGLKNLDDLIIMLEKELVIEEALRGEKA